MTVDEIQKMVDKAISQLREIHEGMQEEDLKVTALLSEVREMVPVKPEDVEVSMEDFNSEQKIKLHELQAKLEGRQAGPTVRGMVMG